MKKYIRTKDGVYKITNEDLTKYYVKNNHYCIDELTRVVISGAYKKTDKDIKVADTIEELCDEFVGFGNDGTRLIWNKTDWLDLKEKILANKHWIKIYGAVWCEWGLKYVAKANSKGELELL